MLLLGLHMHVNVCAHVCACVHTHRDRERGKRERQRGVYYYNYACTTYCCVKKKSTPIHFNIYVENTGWCSFRFSQGWPDGLIDLRIYNSIFISQLTTGISYSHMTSLLDCLWHSLTSWWQLVPFKVLVWWDLGKNSKSFMTLFHSSCSVESEFGDHIWVNAKRNWLCVTAEKPASLCGHLMKTFSLTLIVFVL